jgi:hypothetical protein
MGESGSSLHVSGEATTIKREEVGAPPRGVGHPLSVAPLPTPALYIRRWWRPLQGCSFPCSFGRSLPLFLLIHPTSNGLGEALLKLFLHQHHHVGVLLEFPGGSSSSAAPLERGNGGHRQAVRVTKYGSATPCGARLLRDLEIGK